MFRDTRTGSFATCLSIPYTITKTIKMNWTKHPVRILTLLLSTALLFSACKKDKDENPAGGGGYPKDVTIEYRVTTTTSNLKNARVTYINETGGNSTEDAAALPFSKKFRKNVKQYDVILIQGSAYTGGNLKLEILVNDQVVESESFSGTSTITGSTAYGFQ